jgi:superfamily I DNA and/or RNA helicase
LFEFCVKRAATRHIDLSKPKNHNQWAIEFFGTQKEQDVYKMSLLHDSYGVYFEGKGLKYTFNADLIVQDFPQWFKGYISPQYANKTEELLANVNTAVDQEIRQSRDKRNEESYQVEDWDEHAYNKKYLYSASIKVKEDSDPHFREGSQIRVVDKYHTYYCEVVEYDYEEGVLHFTSELRVLIQPMYARIIVDKSFILDGLKKRVSILFQRGISSELPVYKFVNKTTDTIEPVSHEPIPEELYDYLDSSQQEAFKAAIDNDITLIWGPPGTGKSFTLAAVIRGLYELKEERTAVCCISNVAVDQLVNKVVDVLEMEGLEIEPGNFYRAGHTTDERITETDFLFPKDDITRGLRQNIKGLRTEVEELTLKGKKTNAEKIIELKARIKDFRVQLHNRTDYLVQKSRVVFSTIANFVLNDNLLHSTFDNLIVDEASMLALPNLLALAGNVTKRIILVGDFQQLSPIALVPNPLLSQNVFQRCGIDIEHTDHPALHLLLNQRRSHEQIVKLINHSFYEDQLKAAITTTNSITKTPPFSDKVITTIEVPDGEVRFTRGGTRQNPRSADVVVGLLDLLKENVAPNVSIGVITPYRGQANMIRALKTEQQYPASFDKQIRIGTVHTFQGSECDIIIFDIVDCEKIKDHKNVRVGKIYDREGGEQLINVAISRARHKLIVVGNVRWFGNFAPGNAISPTTRALMRELTNSRVFLNQPITRKIETPQVVTTQPAAVSQTPIAPNNNNDGHKTFRKNTLDRLEYLYQHGYNIDEIQKELQCNKDNILYNLEYVLKYKTPFDPSVWIPCSKPGVTPLRPATPKPTPQAKSKFMPEGYQYHDPKWGDVTILKDNEKVLKLLFPDGTRKIIQK